MNQKIQFVLVRPSHPGNIGAVARAIATMGFDQLALVSPSEHPVSPIRDFVDEIASISEKQKISIVFGPETSGLSNEEIDRCNHLVYIPSGEKYSSLNLAMAVQVVAYEVKMSLSTDEKVITERNLASGQEMELFYAHLKEVLLETGFLNPRNPKQLMRRLRALFNRAELDENEVNIMRGILTSYQKPKE